MPVKLGDDAVETRPAAQDVVQVKEAFFGFLLLVQRLVAERLELVQLVVDREQVVYRAVTRHWLDASMSLSLSCAPFSGKLFAISSMCMKLHRKPS